MSIMTKSGLAAATIRAMLRVPKSLIMWPAAVPVAAMACWNLFGFMGGELGFESGIIEDGFIDQTGRHFAARDGEHVVARFQAVVAGDLFGPGQGVRREYHVIKLK